ncbi:MAG TPA: ATP-binding protein [Flavitalea sp.]|nr:ATP-binding protein [Flavitalea sp.]
MIKRLKAFRNRRLTIVTAVYWFLLLYIIAALVWWFIELERQNRDMAAVRLNAVATNEAQQKEQVEKINEDTRRHTVQFAMEGITFLVLIMLSAGYVYRALRRQIRLQQQQQNFMMAVTHELKTPIAVAKLNLETLQRHQLGKEKTDKLISNTLQETNRLNQLANNILVSSQLDGGGYKITREDIDLSLFLQHTITDFSQRFPDREWISDIEPGVEFIGDPLLIGILVNNLLENAYKYSSAGTSIEMKLHTMDDHVILQVLDQGPGIPDNEKKNIFQQFYRIGNEQTRSTKGTGLGLHLCKKIAADHNGKINVKDNQPKGSNFIIRFRQ